MTNLHKRLRLPVVLMACLASAVTLDAQDPDYRIATPSSAAYSPMTGHERWKDYLETNYVQSGAYFQTFFTALGDETGNLPAEWGGGVRTFPRHFASQFARFSIGGSVKSSAAAVLQEDTRFQRCRCEGSVARARYAVSRSFLTYDSHGRTTPNIAGLAGIYSGPMVMTTWYPARYTAWGYGVRQGNLALGITAGIDLIREFSPEIKNLFLRRRPGQNSIR